MTCYLDLLRSHSEAGLSETSQLQGRGKLYFFAILFLPGPTARISFPGRVSLLMLLFMQLGVNCSAPVFQHSAEPRVSTQKIFIQQNHCLPVAHFPGVTESQSLPLRALMGPTLPILSPGHLTLSGVITLITDDVRLTCHCSTD